MTKRPKHLFLSVTDSCVCYSQYHRYDNMARQDRQFSSQPYLQHQNGMQETFQRNQHGDRKSSGYDSLEGESSSLDSSPDSNEILFNRNTTDTVPSDYALPSDQKDNAMHYDEVNKLKMEIKRHPNILHGAY